MRNTMIRFLLVLVLTLSCAGCQSDNQTAGVALYQEALKLENEKSFDQASKLYEQALPILTDENNTQLSFACSEAMQRLMIFREMYPYTSDQIEDILLKTYPLATAEQINSWITSKDMEYLIWDDEEHYFADAARNLKFRDMDLMHADMVAQQKYYEVVSKMIKTTQEETDHFWSQYQNPATYRGIHTIFIPRDKLPEVGTYRIWFPISINNGPQTDVVIESVVPDKWVKQPPSIDRDIGLLYMEVPMEELKEDLSIRIEFIFTHYEQRFSVDPNNVGEYEKDSALYQMYTGSYGNTEITPDISKKAADIVGDETNPYLAARRIYDYIVNHVDYSFMPHYIFQPRTSTSESVYVHDNQRGDCGGQSLYFSAMCRSLGIPARTTGGWQLFENEFGSHFWAEFYLPNYGWIPVDTSLAQLAFYPKELTEEQRHMFIDFYFGNQDSMRCVVQKDTDLSLIPQAQGMVLIPMAIQTPTVEYTIPTGEISDNVFFEHWTISCEKVNP